MTSPRRNGMNWLKATRAAALLVGVCMIAPLALATSGLDPFQPTPEDHTCSGIVDYLCIHRHSDGSSGVCTWYVNVLSGHHPPALSCTHI